MKKRLSGKQIVLETNKLFEDLTPENINQIVMLNEPIVIIIAMEHRPRAEEAGLQFEDLTQEGMIGLRTAVIKFDLTRGVPFYTHAKWWVSARIRRTIDKTSPVLGATTHNANSYLSIIGKVERELTRELGRKPTREEVFPLTGFSRPMFDDLLRFRGLRKYSLDEPGEDGDIKRDILADHEGGTPESQLISKEDSGFMKEVKTLLTEFTGARNTAIFMASFETDADHAKNNRQIGLEFGLTRERVRQIIKLCLEKLQEEYPSRGAWETRATRSPKRKT